jgi:hypothetical protein
MAIEKVMTPGTMRFSQPFFYADSSDKKLSTSKKLALSGELLLDLWTDFRVI